jgi:hypothetical protein
VGGEGVVWVCVCVCILALGMQHAQLISSLPYHVLSSVACVAVSYDLHIIP